MEWNMANENKVKSLTIRSRQVFLKDVFKNPEEKYKGYDLHDEFAKTKKNKNTLVYIAILGFAVVAVFTTILTLRIIHQKDLKMVLDIGDFQDVNLSQLLSTAKQNENKLDNARGQVAGLQLQKQQEASKIKLKYSGLTEGVRARKLKEVAEKREIGLLKQKEQDELHALDMKYMEQIGKAKSVESTLQKDVDAYDQRMKETVKKAEVMVNNVVQLMNIRLEKQKSELTSLYDPVFQTNDRMLLDKLPRTASLDNNLKEFYPHAVKENAISRSNFEILRKNIQTEYALIARLRNIPYKNSVSDSLKGLDVLSHSLINRYEDALEKLGRSASEKNDTLESYKYAVNWMASQQAEGGYVIDSRNTSSIKICLNKLYSVKSGQIGTIFRSDRDVIAKIRFLTSGNPAKAEIIEVQPDRKIEPFDKVMINIPSEK